jgi:hypothetical protein
LIERLANARLLSGIDFAGSGSPHAAAVALFHQWYRDGFLHLG